MHSRLVPIFPKGIWATVSQSDIAYGAFVEMRGRNPWTAGYHGFLFILIVKSDIKIFVWSVDKSNDLYLVCRDRRPRLSNVVTVTNCISVCYQNKDNGEKKYIDPLF